MFRVDKVDVVAAGRLKIHHDVRKFRGRDFGAFAKLAGLKILAKHTTQIAPAEENCPGTIPTTQAILFTEMRKRARNSRGSSTLAHADVVVQSIDLAIARTDATRTKRLQGLLYAALENSFLVGAQIRRYEIFAPEDELSVPMEGCGHHIAKTEHSVHTCPSGQQPRLHSVSIRARRQVPEERSFCRFIHRSLPVETGVCGKSR